MSLSILTVVVDCREPDRQAAFWASILGYEVSQRNPDEFEVYDRGGGGRSLYFMKVPEPKTGKNRLHLDLVTEESMDAAVDRLIAAGATRVELRQDPDTFANPDTWTVMLDPEGNEFCVTSSSTLSGWS